MEAEEKARISVAIERIYRKALEEETASYTNDPKEQIQIVIGVVVLMMRRLYKDLGVEFLETVVRQVMTPEPELTTETPREG